MFQIAAPPLSAELVGACGRGGLCAGRAESKISDAAIVLFG